MMLVLTLLLGVFETMPTEDQATVHTAEESKYIPSAMVFKIKAGPLSPEAAAKELTNFTGLVDVHRLFREGGRFESRHRAEGLHLWYKATVPPDTGAEAMERLFKRTDLVAKASAVPKARKAAPNDPYYAQQPHFPTLGMEEAWAISAGKPNVIIAIIDSGVDMQHPEMRSNAWLNTGEICGNGEDDDGNGYVDDCNGYNFADDTGRQLFGDDSHGTHCAGCAIGGSYLVLPCTIAYTSANEDSICF
mmetsp:Transcript_10662/g.20634  ORF Transcript_10662/g.20634 Transcript_10662/m.20634 type:complete len:247 (-) Transcript_10662:402-1142(-)